MTLASEAQLIIQQERTDGTFDCTGYVGLPILHSTFLVLSSSGSQTSRSYVRKLCGFIVRELRILAPGLQRTALSCGGQVIAPDDCVAFRHPGSRRVLVHVGDSDPTLPNPPFYQRWPLGRPEYRVLPVYPERLREAVTKALPPEFRTLNVAFWKSTLDELVPTILSLTGLAQEARRVFISYRRNETEALAVQLFDALSHRGFDVFLDYFRIPPGVDFQARLRQELGDKSLVLVLESLSTLSSEWTTYEINVAKVLGLGLLALNVPTPRGNPTPLIPGVDDEARLRPQTTDFHASGQLKEVPLQHLLQRIESEHARFIVRRRERLRGSLEGALRLNGIQSWSATNGGISFDSSGTRYVVWLTPRPPELADFHDVHCSVRKERHTLVRGIVIGLTGLMEPLRRSRADWLADLADLSLVDEGRLAWAVREMVRGTL